MTTASSSKGKWTELAFSEAVEVNPGVGLKRGEVYPFVDMASVDGSQRTVSGIQKRDFKGSGSKFQNGDTLMARITPCLENGKIARYRALGDQQQAHGSTEFIVLRGRPGITTDDFAYYLTRWEEVRQYAIGQMTGTSGRQRVPVDSLDHLTIPVPTVSEQQAITHILGTLDDKIELNRRMNRTLEEMARAVFKDWFVDFGPTRAKMEGLDPYLPSELWDLFPDNLVDSELGEIPEGWEVKPLDHLVTLNPKETMKKGIEAPYLDMASLPTDGCYPGKPVTRGFNSGSRFRNGDTLLARITPCLENGKTAYVHCLPNETTGWGSTEFIVMRGIPPTSPEYTYLLARNQSFRSHAILSMTGTSGRQRVQTEALATHLLPVPTEDAHDAFASTVQPLFRRIEANREEMDTLTAQRDALLPGLVSGRVSVTSV